MEEDRDFTPDAFFAYIRLYMPELLWYIQNTSDQLPFMAPHFFHVETTEEAWSRLTLKSLLAVLQQLMRENERLKIKLKYMDLGMN